MATEYEYTVTLHGNNEKLQWAEKIIEDATYDASSKMVAFLSSYYLSVPEAYEDADCHHLSLLAMLFCRADEKEVVANEAWRDFLSGCSTVKDGTMEVYCRIAGDVDAFFSSLVEHSDYLQSYEAVCDEDEDYDEDDMEGERREDYVVTLYGDSEKLKWIADIVKQVMITHERMGSFLSSYGVTVPGRYQDEFCNSASLLGVLLCAEDMKEYVADSLSSYAIKDYHLVANGVLSILFDNLDEYGDNNVNEDFDYLIQNSVYLSGREIDTEFDGENAAFSPVEETDKVQSVAFRIYGYHYRLRMVNRIIGILLEDKSTSCSMAVLPVVFSPTNEQAHLASLGNKISIVKTSLNENYLDVCCQFTEDESNDFYDFLRHLCKTSQFISSISIMDGARSYSFTNDSYAQQINAF